MKILIIGSGGREHALAWKLAQSNKVKSISVSPGNAGTATLNKCQNVQLADIPEMIAFAKAYQVELTVVGPEALLVEGIADAFEAEGLRIFAPNKASAQLEGSKAYSKDFMEKYGVRTATYRNFKAYSHAADYLNMITYPTVVKASGLAAGKGVIICQNQREADQALKDIMLDSKFGGAGAEVVIEEFLDGVEASILSVCDGNTILPFISAKDHKKIGEGETGLNTGGMGVVAPNPHVSDTILQDFNRNIALPTLKGIQEEGLAFKGVIFFGVMITDNGCHCLEYNTRFGDPETQAVLPLLDSDLLDILEATLNQELHTIQPSWKNEHSCCIVGASGGYPESYNKGVEISVSKELNTDLFIAGAQRKNGKTVTSGGRVLNVVATAPTLDAARTKAYEGLEHVSFENMYFRKDIGKN